MINNKKKGIYYFKASLIELTTIFTQHNSFFNLSFLSIKLNTSRKFTKKKLQLISFSYITRMLFKESSIV